MLRNLLDEVVRRRLWPLLAIGALVLLAAPLLFLKSAPEGSPTAETAAPAAPATAKLPARAARLLATSDAGGASGRATGSPRDPFIPPSSQQTSASAGATTDTTAKSTSTSTTAKKNKPIPVVIQNSDGSSTTSNGSKSDGTSGDSSSSAPSSALTAGSAAVAVRFGKSQDSTLRRAVPPMQAFFIRGKVAAVFVKYSPSLRKAVFAVAPGIHVSGPVTCRVQNGACRYLDIPAGSYVRLTMITAKREVVRRRLDVEHITRRSSQKTAAAASASDVSVCFLHKLQAMKPGSPLVDRDACER